jgi:ATPase
MSSTQRLVPDTSAIINGRIPEIVEKGDVSEIIIPHAALDELQAQASKGREVGHKGLAELKKLRALCEQKNIKLTFMGSRPDLDQIKLARSGRLDAIIIDVARKENATLVTADYVQALVAEVQGLRVLYSAPSVKTEGLIFESLFTPDTASVHVKEGTLPLAKRGKPGKFELIKISDRQTTSEELEQIIKQINDAAHVSDQGFVEISRVGASVIQLGRYRIAITRPPFSDGLELTIVRPIVTLRLEDYRLSEKLMERLKSKAEGILIAGPPGSGKTTFASSLAEFYLKQNKIVKTLESPRDLQVGPEITQYGPLEGDFENTAEILLLVRPDYTVFDEVRKTKDFQVFADMRLAGVGMIGVVHATDAIDAVQRFIGRVELGMIPHIIDTIIFVRYGEVVNVFCLNLVVRVPSGMTEADLARPIVEARDFETGKLEYEMYTFGEENVVVPVSEAAPQVSGARKLAAERVLQEIRRFDPQAEVTFISENKAVLKVDSESIPILIGKKGATISKLEKSLGISIDVEPATPTGGSEARFRIAEFGNRIDLEFDKKHVGQVASVYIDNEYLFSATVGKKSQIRVSKGSDLGKALLRAKVGEKAIKILV